MSGVDIVGVGMTAFTRHPDKTGRDLIAEAAREAVSHVDKGINLKKDVKALFVGYFTPEMYEHQGHTSTLYAEWLGLSGIPAFRTEAACCSSSCAIVTGYWAISSGTYDVVMIAGVEKMTSLPTVGVTDALAVAADDVYELPAGVTFPGLFALMAQEYFQKYNVTWDDMQAIPIKNHHNGTMNPKAQFKSEIIDRAKKVGAEKGVTFRNEMDFLRSKYNPVIAYPLRLFDCCPVSDGAAVAFLTTSDVSKRYTDMPLHVVGVGLGTDTIALHGREDLTTSRATVNAGRAAYKMVGIEPKHVDIAEVHDCFTINEIMTSEDLGFFERGEGIKAAKEGTTSLTGDKPINTDGGLKCKGHPVGATGIGMLNEIWLQLRGQAGKRQVQDSPEIGLMINVGGSGASAVVLILGR